jgi:hypothetical protein
MKSLRCVLAATVTGARGPRVLLKSGLMAPSRADVAGHPAQLIFIRPRVARQGHDLLRRYGDGWASWPPNAGPMSCWSAWPHHHAQANADLCH